MILKVISVGKPDKYFWAIINKYAHKCNKYYKLEHDFLRDTKIKDEKTRLKKEEEQINGVINQAKKPHFICAMDEKGKQFTTESFSKFIKKRILSAVDLYFIIGGAGGLPENIKKSADLNIRLSDLTLQHDVALTVLFEQIYRAFTILKRVPYHK